MLGLVDMILIMTVNPGFGGQGFISDMVHKIQRLKKMIEDYKRLTGKHDRVIDIQVDGGINLDTAPKVVGAGATVLSVGTSIFRADDPVAFVKSLRQKLTLTI